MDTFVCIYSQSIVKHNFLPYLSFKEKGRLKQINKNANKSIPNEMPFHRNPSAYFVLFGWQGRQPNYTSNRHGRILVHFMDGIDEAAECTERIQFEDLEELQEKVQ